MAKELKKGDPVEWNTPQGKTTGKVRKKLTSPTKIKGHEVKASEENPEYLVETDESHRLAAHAPEALKRIGRKK
jgi:heme-binding NEAT domain protein